MDPNRLTAIPIFSELRPEEANRLAAFATETSAAEGQILMKEGDLIGEMGLLAREPRNADVIATSPMRLMKLTHWEIRRMSDDTVERIKQTIQERLKAGVADPAN